MTFEYKLLKIHMFDPSYVECGIMKYGWLTQAAQTQTDINHHNNNWRKILKANFSNPDLNKHDKSMTSYIDPNYTKL